MFSNARIAVRLGMGFGAIISLLILVSAFSMIQMDILANATSRLYEHPFAVSNNAREVDINTVKIQHSMKDALLSADSTELEEAVRRIGIYEKQAYESLDIIEERFLGDKDHVEEIKDLMSRWAPLRDEVISLMRAGDQATAVALSREKGARHVENLEQQVAHLQEFARGKATDFMDEARRTEKRAFFWIYALVILAVVVSTIIAYITSRVITRPLESGVRAASRLAEGDMTVEIESASGDETGQLLKALATMTRNLREMARETREGVNVLASSASEIMASTTQVVSGGTETASAVNQTTSTVEEVKQTVEVASQKARAVAEDAQSVSRIAKDGRTSVEVSVEGMNRIQEQMESIAESIVQLGEQSQAIGEIIATVNDLAEQSNLLSVNAAIEAAKAGEHGKGFAVVAQEVRSLAEQSREATAQVRTILEDIQKATDVAVMATEQGSKAVDSGSSQIAEAGEAIRTLEQSVSQSAQAAVQIQASSQQQVVGVDQIVQAMENIKQASTQNVDSMRQVEETVKNFHELGQKLKQLTDRYQV